MSPALWEIHLNARQFQQLCDSPRTIYVVFDADTNGSGPRASQSLARRLCAQGVTVRRSAMPDGHDPNSFFVQGGDVRQFQSLLQTRCHEVPPHLPIHLE